MSDFDAQRERVARRVRSAVYGASEGFETGATAEDTHAVLKSDVRAMKAGKRPVMELPEVMGLWDKFPKAAHKWLKANQKQNGGVQ